MTLWPILFINWLFYLLPRSSNFEMTRKSNTWNSNFGSQIARASQLHSQICSSLKQCLVLRTSCENPGCWPQSLPRSVKKWEDRETSTSATVFNSNARCEALINRVRSWPWGNQCPQTDTPPLRLACNTGMLLNVLALMCSWGAESLSTGKASL